MFQAGNTGGGLILLERAKPGEIYVYIQSEDVDADLARIKAAGGKIVEGRMEIPNMGAMAVFEDPTGNKLALWQSFHQERVDSEGQGGVVIQTTPFLMSAFR